jgi:hypothetical protein
MVSSRTPKQFVTAEQKYDVFVRERVEVPADADAQTNLLAFIGRSVGPRTR